MSIASRLAIIGVLVLAVAVTVALRRACGMLVLAGGFYLVHAAP
jgi:hypothetical protein